MKINGKNSYLEDLGRIKSGYSPRNRFIFLYNIIPIFILTKLIVYKLYKHYINNIIHSARPQKRHHIDSDYFIEENYV
jgi:hypothetical protein